MQPLRSTSSRRPISAVRFAALDATTGINPSNHIHGTCRMNEYSEKEIAEARAHVIKQLETDVRGALKERKEKGLSSTVFPATESFCEQGAAYVEFNDFSAVFPRLILARKGLSLELSLYVGSTRDIGGLTLVEEFGAYSIDIVRKAVDAYFFRVRRIIEST